MKETALCCFCGIREAKTKDHVPPKSIFNLPRPNNLITVPACMECNNAASKNEEIFTAYLGMHISKKRGPAEKFFQEKTIPVVRHNGRLRNYIFSNLKSLFLASENGVAEKMYGMLWDSDVHDSVIEKIARGLFFHHYKTIIGNNANVDVHWYNKLPAGMINNLYYPSVQDGAFTYFFNKAEETPYDSVWLFQFYDAHWAGAIITSER